MQETNQEDSAKKAQENQNVVGASGTAGKKNQSGSVTLYALSMAVGTMTSRILGLIRDQLFAAMFSPTVRDAWTAAFRLPNLFRRLLGEGSLSVNFIPVFVESRVTDPSGESARNLVNSFYTLLLIVLSVLTAVGILFPEFFLNLLLDPKFSEVPGKFEMTVRMARIMFSFIFFMSTFAYFMGILNALGRYGLPAMAPTFFNVAMIISNFIPQDILPMPGDAISWGVVIGGILQTAVLIPALKQAGYLPRLSKDIFDPKVLRILKNMVPGMLGLGLLQITTVVNMRFASSLGEGPITYIYLADRLLELPLSLVSVSLGTALLPTLSTLWAEKQIEKMNETVRYYFGLNLYIALPAALGLFVLGLPIVEVLFQRGKFSLADAGQTALVVQIYSFILISSSCVRVLVPSFYAIQNTKVPAIASGIALVVHVLIAPLLMNRFGLGGLVASSFISGMVNLLILSYFFRKYVGALHVLEFLGKVARFAVPAAALGAVLFVYTPLLQALSSLVGGDSFSSAISIGSSSPSAGLLFVAKLVALIFTIVPAAIAYFLVSHWMNLPEYRQSTDLIFGKIKRKFGK